MRTRLSLAVLGLPSPDDDRKRHARPHVVGDRDLGERSRRDRPDRGPARPVGGTCGWLGGWLGGWHCQWFPSLPHDEQATYPETATAPAWRTSSGAVGCRQSLRGSGCCGLQRIPELVGLLGRHLDDEAPTTLERDAHHDAATLLGDLKGTVAGPGLHGRHSMLPPSAFPPVRCA